MSVKNRLLDFFLNIRSLKFIFKQSYSFVRYFRLIFNNVVFIWHYIFIVEYFRNFYLKYSNNIDRGLINIFRCLFINYYLISSAGHVLSTTNFKFL